MKVCDEEVGAVRVEDFAYEESIVVDGEGKIRLSWLIYCSISRGSTQLEGVCMPGKVSVAGSDLIVAMMAAQLADASLRSQLKPQRLVILSLPSSD